jgi:hypothetical protein
MLAAVANGLGALLRTSSVRDCCGLVTFIATSPKSSMRSEQSGYNPPV